MIPQQFLAALMDWYSQHQRPFPWRTQYYSNKNQWAYQTWICEVMSQQTILSVVLPKFNTFVQALPDVQALARCSDDELRGLWSGLGYYARARNLRRGAQFILSHHQGIFPQTKEEWLAVPGCGDYTASMIASICFAQVVPAIDGNVTRVASRLLGLQDSVWETRGKQRIADFLQTLMTDYFAHTHTETPGNWNQAFIELGATVCKKNQPSCGECPLSFSCRAYQDSTVHLCPPIKPRKATLEVSLFALVLQDQHQRYLVVQRESHFLAHTKGFPLFATVPNIVLKNATQLYERAFSHTITHHKLRVSVLVAPLSCALAHQMVLPSQQFWVEDLHEGKHLASSLDRKVLKTLSLS